MSFADIIRDQTGTSSLLRLVESDFTQTNEKNPLSPNDYLRASGIPSLCAREEVLCSQNRVVRTEVVDAGLNLTFLHGTALHWAIQNQLFGPMGILFGTWRCDECGFRHGEAIESKRVEEWSVPRPSTCEFDGCKSSSFTYVEHKFVDQKLRLTGHSDGFLRLPGLPGMGILEIKSVGQKSAREIQQAPQIGHMVQAHVYMMLTGFKWARILYWQKGEFGVKALVEHHIDRDEETITRIKDLVSSVWAGLAVGTLPERICATETCPRAKGCAVASKCFSL